MKEINYVGEHLLIGNLGKASVYLALAAALFSLLSYIFAQNRPEEEKGFWKRAGRASFFIHGFSVLSIFTLLFFIIQRHYFEYQYAWQHSSTDLPLRYMISCFWEGQEGSFLLWMTWHVILGSILIFTTKKWESPVMAVVAIAQVMLASMLVGIEFMDYKIGSSPFNLLRDTTPGPIFSRPDYLEYITDGNGLNPLLQNYWMVIHPPTLFLGFAAAIVPFAYACAGLWTRQYKEWIRPALPWTLFGVMVLGAGIIMGGFWAYESLSFGGYWAWDPVENASLIPWLILIATVHVMLVNLKTGKAQYITIILALFSFLLVLYATFLTRSGILGDTSVHAFTDLGMSGQLLIFLFMFIWLPSQLALQKGMHRLILAGLCVLVLLINAFAGYTEWVTNPFLYLLLIFLFFAVYRVMPKGDSTEDELSSREFWMFIGALVFVISCFHILINTSMPVWNKIFGLSRAPHADVVAYYNQWQLPFALIIGLLTGTAQLLKYRKTPFAQIRKFFTILLVVSFVLTAALTFLFELHNPLHIALLFAACVVITGNLQYLFQVLKGKIQLGGAAVAHFGFGLMLAGVVASSAGKRVISINQSNFDFGERFNQKEKRENILFWKNTPVRMAEYEVTYIGDTIIHPNTYYKVHYQRLNPETGEELKEEFILEPNAQNNEKMGLVANPDTRHYLTRDIFTHVTSVPDKEGTRKAPFSNFKEHELGIGDTIFSNNGRAVLAAVVPIRDKASLGLQEADYVLMAEIQVVTLSDTLWAQPVMAIKGNQYSSFEADLHEAGLRFKLTGIRSHNDDVSQMKFLIETGEKSPVQDYIILKAYVFPFINLLWAGTIIMVIGFAIAISHRIRENRRKSASLA